jgi:Cys-tRNA(Pro)/Cys-tRNA(Cys) deacylase
VDVATRRAMTPAIDAARRAGIEHRVIEFAAASQRNYGAAAATALGVDASCIFKTLVLKVDGRLVCALVPVACELDLKALAALAGAKRAEMANPREAERATGYVVGGISPLGQRRRLPIFADASAAAPARVYVSAGRRGLELELSGADLLACCSATVGAIAR